MTPIEFSAAIALIFMASVIRHFLVTTEPEDHDAHDDLTTDEVWAYDYGVRLP